MTQINNLELFINFHKDYDLNLSDITFINKENFKILKNKNNIHSNLYNLGLQDMYNPMILDERLYSELSNIYWLYLKIKECSENFSNFIGTCHYRRYFDLNALKQNNINLTSDLIIIPEILVSKNNIMTYEIYHNIDDLKCMFDVINDLYPNYINALNIFSNTNWLLTYNMFISSKEIFLQYCEFIFNCLFEIDKRLNINGIYENALSRIENNRDKYFKDFFNNTQNNTAEYQGRILSFLAERLTTIFFINLAANNSNLHFLENKLIKIDCF